MEDVKKLSDTALDLDINDLEWKRYSLQKKLSVPRSSKRPEPTHYIERNLERIEKELKPLYEERQRRKDDQGIIFSKTTWNKIKSPVYIILFLIGLYILSLNAGLTLEQFFSNFLITIGSFGLLGLFLYFLVRWLGLFFGLLVGWIIVYLVMLIV